MIFFCQGIRKINFFTQTNSLMDNIDIESTTSSLTAVMITIVIFALIVGIANLIVGSVGFAKASKHKQLELWAIMSIIGVFFPPLGIIFGAIAWRKAGYYKNSRKK
jgi:hypothetical protein